MIASAVGFERENAPFKRNPRKMSGKSPIKIPMPTKIAKQKALKISNNKIFLRPNSSDKTLKAGEKKMPIKLGSEMHKPYHTLRAE